jgi:fused signal recognition particle receptor
VSNKFFSGLFGKKNNQEEKRETDASSNATETAGGPTVSAPRDAAPIAQVTPDAAPQINPPSPGGASDDTPKPKKGWLSRLTAGLSKSSEKLTSGVTSIFTKRKLDDETLEELQDLLIISDLGVAAAMRITGALARDKFDKEITDEEVRIVLASEVSSTLTPLEKPLLIDGAGTPHVILMIGVNGAGKTTTIGKLAQKFKAEGKSVMLAAGDTFRAAAIEQLTVWGERTGAPVIARDVGSDAASLAFDAFKEAQAAGTDILIIDTAGRLQNKSALMDELAKIVRVLKKLDETAPHDVVLVLDATVGQNAISQAQAFSDIAGVTGLVMTKLDGTARGGVLVALADKFALPIHFIGVGESVDDLQPFHADSFARALAGLDKYPV